MRPVSKLTRIRILAEDVLGYKDGDFNYKVLKKLLKEVSIKKYTFSSYAGGTQFHPEARATIVLKVGRWYVEAGNCRIVTNCRYRDGAYYEFIIIPKVKLNKLIKVLKNNMKCNLNTRKYFFNYLRNNKSLKELKQFLVLKTFGGARP